MKRLKSKGGLDTIIAYAVCSLPLLYMLIYLVCTFIHFTTQSYVDQIVKETLVLISTTGKVDTSIVKFANDRLIKFDSDFQIEITRAYYDDFTDPANPQFKDDPTAVFSDNGVDISADGYTIVTQTLKRGDVLKMKVKSKNPSILSRVGGNMVGSEIYYYSMREEVVQNGKIN